MSGLWIVLIAIGYVIVSGIIFGVLLALTENSGIASCIALLWPFFILATPMVLIGFIAYNITKKIKEKQNEIRREI